MQSMKLSLDIWFRRTDGRSFCIVKQKRVWFERPSSESTPEPSETLAMLSADVVINVVNVIKNKRDIWKTNNLYSQKLAAHSEVW